VLGIGHVLENLDRAGQPELGVGERKVLGAHGAVLEVGAASLLPLRLQLRVLEVDPHDPLDSRAVGPLRGQHAFAAADVEHRGGCGVGE
jgi:hypothetical protein